MDSSEWGDISVLEQSNALNESRGWSIRARATWKRASFPTLHIKYTAARRHGGKTTRIYTDDAHLKRVLSTIHKVQSVRAPIVETPVAYITPHDESLLLAMESVQTLGDALDTRTTDDGTAVSVLERFLLPHETSWAHFDIHPQNAGLNDAGLPVLLDLDSLVDLDDLTSLQPGWMLHRVPVSLQRRVTACVSGREQFSRSLIVEKHNAETIVLAAECALGRLPADGTVHHLDAALVERWVQECPRSEHEAVVKVIKEELMRLVLGDSSRQLQLASSIRQASAAELRDRLETTRPAPPPSSHSLQSAAGMLRAGKLTGEALDGYWNELTASFARADAEPWIARELLLIAMAFRCDPDAALPVAEAARNRFCGDRFFEEMVAVLSLWRGRA